MSNSGNVKDAPPDYLLKVDQPLVVPVGKKVRIITTANDVIHSFMVPAFGIKQDAIPGFVRDTWFKAEKPGDYYGQCAELCGKEHAYMPIHVKVLLRPVQDLGGGRNQEGCLQARRSQQGLEAGRAGCARRKSLCRQLRGLPPAQWQGAGPIKALDGSPVVLGPLAEAMHVVLEGRNNGAMPAWKALSDVELAAVLTFAKNHWSNKTGQLIQPAQFKDARGGKFPEGGAAAPARHRPLRQNLWQGQLLPRHSPTRCFLPRATRR
jgi:cytochrome c oxidase subunit 2